MSKKRISLWKKMKDKLSSAKQLIMVTWSTHQATVIAFVKAIFSKRVGKALIQGVAQCAIQGAVAFGLCALGSTLAKSFIGQIIFPGFFKMLSAMGGQCLAALDAVLPGFLQFIPELIAMSIGWPLLIIPAGLMGYELYRKGLPENWWNSTSLYTMVAIIAPVASYPYFGLSLSTVFMAGFWGGMFWNLALPALSAVHTQYLDGQNRHSIRQSLPNSNRSEAASTLDSEQPKKAPTKAHKNKNKNNPTQKRQVHPRPRARAPNKPVTPHYNRQKQQRHQTASGKKENQPVKNKQRRPKK